jgi:branched-chain amino acid transport system permease protein
LEILPQAITNGLLLGGIYAVAALGFSLVWGVLNIINVAHGAFVMLGAYVAFFLFDSLGVDPFLGALAAFVVLFAFGYLVQAGLLNLIVRAPIFTTLILTFGLNLIIVNIALLVFTGDFRSINTGYAGQGLHIFGIVLPYTRFAALGVALIASALLFQFMDRTRTGNAIRATRMDLEAAEIVGIGTARIYALTFAIGTGLAGLSGALVAATAPITPVMGLTFTGKAFVVAALGGLGNMYGALLGGLVLGVAETVGAAFFGPGLQDAIGYIVLVVILIVRPQGLAGRIGYA